MTYKMTEECRDLFKALLTKLDQITEQQFDLLQELHSQALVTSTVWESVLISKRLLKKERRKRKKNEKGGVSLKQRWITIKQKS